MENAVANLEALFQKADSDVNNLSQRLKCEFEDNDETVNPAALLPKLEEAKRDYAGLVQQAADIQHAQMEAMTEFRGHLNDVCQLLLTLQSKSGAEMTEKPAELCRLESFLGTSVPWGVPEPDNSLVGSETPGSGGEGSRVSCPGSDISTCSDQKAGVESSGQCRDGDFVPVSETEFESVSSLIRGKVKLADVNSTYKSLSEYFKENKSVKTLSSGDMYKMGLRVTGVTGTAKLKVLRALKIVKLSPKGDVSMA
ncbi:uncharacterized protein LOC128229731 [Mya arenaria]|uniref:uncharacterized protein LOC128229731 n=1 Tax=Mya arenaria TaxID=6604 RepID=UPI0022E27875|nr:uncharacterized protein LOC128229731 [Mya arenaria]